MLTYASSPIPPTMASTTARTLLQHALPLVKSYGFSREALSLAALSLPRPHTEPLSDEAVSALFGEGEDARRTLIAAWLEKGREEMGNATERTISGSLKARLRWNTPVLKELPEVSFFTGGIIGQSVIQTFLL